MADGAHARAGAVVLVGGHESAGGRDLPRPPRAGALAQAEVHVAAPGKALAGALRSAAAAVPDDRCVVVLPMTLGRDPRLISDAARTVRWAARAQPGGRFALAPPFGTTDHLVAWLRAACRRVSGDAVLIAAPSSDPFDDAELHRVAALVRAHGAGRLVEVGLRSPAGELDAGRERCRRLGAARVAVVPATFGAPPDADCTLLGAGAAAAVVGARVEGALHRLAGHGDDGIAAALGADHAHGFAHSHDHDHEHSHGGRHTHGDEFVHDHGDHHHHLHDEEHVHVYGQG